MTVYLSHRNGYLLIQARAESDDGAAVGDMVTTIERGQDFLGHSYADLLSLGEGEHNITEKELV